MNPTIAKVIVGEIIRLYESAPVIKDKITRSEGIIAPLEDEIKAKEAELKALHERVGEYREKLGEVLKELREVEHSLASAFSQLRTSTGCQEVYEHPKYILLPNRDRIIKR